MLTEIYVFGSNLAGRHNSGKALVAYLDHGAEWGIPFGRQGNSFAIPVRDRCLNLLEISEIKKYVTKFLHYVCLKEESLRFILTPIGVDKGGHDLIDIAPLFEQVYRHGDCNIVFPDTFIKLWGKVCSRKGCVRKALYKTPKLMCRECYYIYKRSIA